MPLIGIDLARLSPRASQGLDLANPSYMSEIRAMGAIAHFYPPVGASDDGTTSMWRDWIGGHTVASTSQATRMVYSTSVSGFNGRPGWVGTAAASTKMVSVDDALAGLLSGTTAHTIYCVRKSTTTYSTIHFCVGTAVGNSTYEYLGNLASGISTAVRFDGSAQTFVNGAVQNLNAPVVESHVFSGTTMSTWSNSGLAGSGANTRALATTRICVGALVSGGAYSSFFDGNIGDIIIFLGAHTDAQRMYVERLIAREYGWPVIQGLRGFSASNYLANAGLSSGIRGDNTNGVWADVLMRPDAVPTGAQYIEAAWLSAQGHALVSTGAALNMFALNGTTSAYSPNYTIVAADVGKLMLFGGAAGPANLVRGFRNGAEIGAGTALTGYQKSTGIAFGAGSRPGSSSASSYSIFGIAGGDTAQVSANHAARAAAIKAAQRFVAHSGIGASNGWALDSVKASYPGISGPDALAMTGTLTATQIILPTIPW